MIYEIRTYSLRPGTVAEAEKRFGEAYEVRKKYSPLAAFFHTDVGPLNEIIHIWPYADMAERALIRAEASREPEWPPKIAEFILNQKVEVLVPFPFAPEWTPANDGPVYELRQYTFRGGMLPEIMKTWESAIPERVKFSPLALLGNIDLGPSTNSFIHLWPFTSMEHRAEIRAQAAATGKWPPRVAGESYVAQSNKLLVPAAFSPAQ